MKYVQIIYNRNFGINYFLTFGYVNPESSDEIISKIWEGYFSNLQVYHSDFKLEILS
jgi:hypothetical protein